MYKWRTVGPHPRATPCTPPCTPHSTSASCLLSSRRCKESEGESVGNIRMTYQQDERYQHPRCISTSLLNRTEPRIFCARLHMQELRRVAPSCEAGGGVDHLHAITEIKRRSSGDEADNIMSLLRPFTRQDAAARPRSSVRPPARIWL